MHSVTQAIQEAIHVAELLLETESFFAGKDGIHANEQAKFKDDVDELHTNFKLRSDEKLALVSPTGDFIDIVDTQELLPNQSFGRRDGDGRC